MGQEESERSGIDDFILSLRPTIQDNRYRPHNDKERTFSLQEEALHPGNPEFPTKSDLVENENSDFATDDKPVKSSQDESVNLYSIWVMLFTVIKSIIGAGSLFLPQAASSLGAFPATFLLIFSAICSGFGLLLLLWLCSKVGRKSSIKSLSEITYKRLGVVFNAVIVPKCFLVAVSYLKMSSSFLFERIFGAGMQPWKQHMFAILVAVILLPLILMKKAGKLRYASYISFAAVLYLLLFSFILLFKFGNDTTFPDDVAGADKKFFWFADRKQLSIMSFFKRLPSFMFAFTCHQNVFPFYNETRDNSRKKMHLLVFLGVGVSLLVYLLFMFASMGTFGKYLSGSNVDSMLNAYSVTLKGKPQWIQVMGAINEILFSILLLCSIPMQTLPLKSSFLAILPVNEDKVQRNANLINWAISLGTMALGVIVVIMASSVKHFVSIIGAVISPLLMAVVPSLYYLKITERKRWNSMKIGVLIFGTFGVVLIGICLTASILTIVQNGKRKN